MLSAICFGTNNLEQSGKFYDEVLAAIGMYRLVENDNEIGYGTQEKPPALWILLPFNKEPATFGNGTQIIFDAPDAETVDRFYRVAMDNGATDEGSPGLRDHTPGYYGAYCRDLDGNKLHVVAMLPQ